MTASANIVARLDSVLSKNRCKQCSFVFMYEWLENLIALYDLFNRG